MSVKSIVDVEVDDQDFKEFTKLFDKYNAALAGSKSKWSDSNKEASKLSSTFGEISASLLAIATMQKKITNEEGKQEDHARKSSTYWRDMVRGSRELAANVASTTKNLLTWGAIGTAFSGLLGVGSLFGLDRLAGAVGSNRRQSLGLGISYGEQQAFGLNYSRVVDPSNFLGSVQDSLQDVTKRRALYGAGLSESDLQGKDAAQVGALLLPRLKALADRTPQQFSGNVLQSRGLDGLISLQEFNRLRGTPASDLASYGRGFANDTKAFSLNSKDQSSWQDFAVQLSRAGRQIETVFVRGLTPLIPGLTRLSDVISRTLGTTLQRLAQSGAIDKFGKGIENFANWLGSDDFQNKVKAFADDIVALGSAVHHTLQFFGLVPKDKSYDAAKQAASARFDTERKEIANSPGGQFNHRVGEAISHGAAVARHYWTFGAYPINNPGNLRPVGQTNGFRQFNNVEEGVIALAKDLRYKETKHGLTTIGDIVKRYAPPSENNTAAYIKDVAHRTGIRADAKLNPNDVRELAKIMAAVIHHENSKTKLTEPMILKILQAPGANVVASSNQLVSQR